MHGSMGVCRVVTSLTMLWPTQLSRVEYGHTGTGTPVKEKVEYTVYLHVYQCTLRTAGSTRVLQEHNGSRQGITSIHVPGDLPGLEA